MDITITPAAEQAFFKLAEERGAQYVRLWAGQACGCGRIGYQMALEEAPAAEDALVPAGPIQLVIAPDSRPHLEGGTIDYIDEPMRSGFTIDNPNVQSGCSCGGHH
jgi:iron-sulfur cluster assembly accessory protein